MKQRSFFSLPTATLLILLTAVSPVRMQELPVSRLTGVKTTKDAVTGAAPGDLDTTFGTGGFVNTTFPGGSWAADIAVQADGKVVVVGSTGSSFPFSPIVLLRYNADGSLDGTFGNGGRTAVTYMFAHGLSGVAIQTDGRIVVVGGASRDDDDFLVARVEPNGTLDTSFGENGFVLVDMGNDDGASDVAIQPDGKIVIVGGSAGDKFAVARLDLDGSLDGSFDGDGRVITTLGGQASAVALQQDGKIVVAGSTPVSANNSDFALVRYLSNGSIDSSFNGDGIVITPVGSGSDAANDVAVQSDGKIVAAGSSTNGFAVARYNNDGSLDVSFSGDGIVETPIEIYSEGYSGSAFSVAIQSNGRILIAGSVEKFNSIDFFGAFVRYEPNGSRDPSFGVNGILIYGSSTDTDIYCHTIQRDGKIVAAGYEGGNVTVARFIGDPVPVNRRPFDFDGDGRSDISVFRPSDNNWYILNTAGYSVRNFGEAGDAAVPADYDSDGKTDIAVWRPSNGTWYLLTPGGQFQVFWWGENGDIPIPADHDGDGRADLVLFRPSTSTWYTRFASGGFTSRQFGEAGDKPLLGDFDGDGRADVAVFRASNSTWYFQNAAGFYSRTFGEAGDVPVPADYDGDGKTDIAAFRPSTGYWYRIGSTEGFRVFGQWGVAGDMPVPADYDGDGKADPAVFRPFDSTWYIVGTTAGITVRQFGQAGDKPTPNAFVY